MEGQMKIILTAFWVSSLLTTLALAQQPARVLGPRGSVVNNPERGAPQTHMAYVINATSTPAEFGAVDLRSGGFVQIGPDLPSDVGDGLVQGPGRSLLSLGFDGKLVAIDPFTGQTSVVGETGLGDCSTPASPCGPDSANWIGVHDRHYYVTDFANNLYSLNPNTATTKLIGSTGIPAITFVPFSQNPDGSVNVFGEGLFSHAGKFYAYFSTQAVNFTTGTYTNLIPGEIYEVDPATGHARAIAPASSNYSAINTINDTIYAFDAILGQVDILDPTTGDATPVSTLDASASVITGVAAAAPRRCR
jgi:hypothetical protein